MTEIGDHADDRLTSDDASDLRSGAYLSADLFEQQNTGAKETLRAEILAMRTEIKSALDRLEPALEIHELEHHR